MNHGLSPITVGLINVAPVAAGALIAAALTDAAFFEWFTYLGIFSLLMDRRANA